MKFYSIILKDENTSSFAHAVNETFLRDLQINEIIESIFRSFKNGGVKDIFYNTLKNSKDVNYRLDVFRNLEYQEIRGPLQNLSESILKFIDLRKESQNGYEYMREAEIIRSLAQIVAELDNARSALKNLKYPSEALEQFGEYLDEFMKSDSVATFKKKLETLKSEIGSIKFCMLMHGNFIKVFKCENQENLVDFINLLFGQKKYHAAEKNSRIEKTQLGPYIRSEIIRLVAGLFPNEFRDILNFVEEFSDLIPDQIVKFAGDFQFYSSYLKMMDDLEKAGFRFCIPKFSEDNTCFIIKGGYNLNLAMKNPSIKKVIPNDIHLDAEKRIAAIIGPNSSGKTTLAMAVGQIAYLASVGLPVPGTYVEIPLFTSIKTLFPHAENVEEMIGRLEDELRRMINILKNSGEGTLIVMNEFLGSTSERDALNLYEEILPMIAEKHSYCIFVTFIDGIQDFTCVRLYSAVVPPDDPTVKSFMFHEGGQLYRNYALELARHYNILFDKHS